MNNAGSSRSAWAEPGVFEVRPGVFRVPLPLPNDGLRAINVYLIITGDKIICIDSGWYIPEARELFVKALRSLGFELSDITLFLITHVHRDHYTLALDIRKDVGTKIALGQNEKPSLDMYRTYARNPMVAQINRLREVGASGVADQIVEIFGGDYDDGLGWDPPDLWLKEGPIDLDGWILEAVETPGHTAGHLVYHDLGAGLLFAGDHILPTITPSIGFEPVLQSNPLGDYLRSLALVRSRPDALLLPGHGPISPSVHARVDELLVHHATRLDQIETAVRSGSVNAFEVAGVIQWTRREYRLKDLDPFNAMLAVLEVHAHLEVLVSQGRVSCSHEERISTYTTL